jgi:hypothetical protein
MPFKCLIGFVLLTFSLAACAGSPARFNIRSHDGNVQHVNTKNNKEICAALEKAKKTAARYSKDSLIAKAENDFRAAAEEVFVKRGYSSNYCENPDKSEYLAARESKDYFIDGLKIRVEKLKDDKCSSGGVSEILLEGAIGPDSSFAIEKLLKDSPDCRDSRNQIISSTRVALSSLGGFLEDGYNMGRSLRKANVTTVIKDGTGCASSCAVAFLGGARRVVEANGAVMFHAPYQLAENNYGVSKVKPDCNVGEKTLETMKSYYTEMAGKEDGERLFERTMWYCSNSDGWVIAGGNAAKLYGIATE